MNKKIKSVLLTLMVSATMLAGCSNSMEKKIEGTWDNYDSNSQIIFYSDGSCDLDGWALSWKSSYGTESYTLLDNNQIRLTDFYGASNTYDLKMNGNSMTLTSEDGYESNWTKR